MARPATITRMQILDAARELFLEQGFSVSTAVIAKAAGVSEGTVFKRFSTKDALFAEAMCPTQLEPGLVPVPGEGDPKEALVQLGERLIALYRELVPRMMRIWAHCQPNETTPLERMRDGPHPPPPIRMRSMITEYVRAEIALERIGQVAPDLFAQTLMATMHSYVFFEMIGGTPHPRPDADYARDVVDMLWRGIAPGLQAPSGIEP